MTNVEEPTEADIRDRAAAWFVSIFFGLCFLVPLALAAVMMKFH